MSIRGMSRTDHITAGATIIGLGVLAALAVAGANTMDPAAEAAPTPSSAWSRLSRSTPAPDLTYTPAPASSHYYSPPTAEPTTDSYGSDFLQRLEAQRTWDESSPSDKQLNCTDYRTLGPAWYRGVLRRAGQSDSEVEAMLTVVRRECT
nr:hypothetical protein [Streptomyces sp. DSM 41633]